MRISDWSSDVCSSDLADRIGARDAIEIGRTGVEIVRFGAPAQNPVDTIERAQRGRNALGVGRLAVVDINDARHLADPLHPVRKAGEGFEPAIEIGRASCRERGGKYVEI